MSELKTLKDLKNTSENPMFNMGADSQRKVIRDEAIKDIKHLQSPESHTDFAADCEAFGNGTKHNIIEYIMWKFNIAEEDLK